MLARQRIEFLFSLRLIGDIDTVAEYKGIHARQLQPFVAIGNDAQLARFSTQIKAPLVILIRFLLQATQNTRRNRPDGRCRCSCVAAFRPILPAE